MAPVPPHTDAAVNGGPERLVMASDELLVEVMPSVGGRIARLVDRVAGVNWLWTNPHLPCREPAYGRSYVAELDAGGWDEILPSVAPCRLATPVGAVSIPDHGDLVQLPWRVVSAGSTHLDMEVAGRSLPFLFRRRLNLSGRRLSLAYQLENRGEWAFPWLWCSHPLVPFDAPVTVETEAMFHVLDALGTAAHLRGRWIGWQELPPRQERWAVKLFSAAAASQRVVVHRRGAGGLELSWNATETPYLGLWVNNGGWSGCGSEPYYNLGIEPSTLPVDDLSAAEDPPVLRPKTIRRWTVQLDLLS